jgi:hypothetical protein
MRYLRSLDLKRLDDGGDRNNAVLQSKDKISEFKNK